MKILKSLMVLLGSFLLVLTSFPLNSSATDFKTAGKEVGGVYVSYSHFLTYTDIKCGMNMQAHYHADARSSLSKIGINWDVTSVFNSNTIIDEGGISYTNRSSLRDETLNRLQIGTSTARYDFQKNGSTWSPTSRATPCVSWASYSLNANTETSEYSDVEKLKNMYYQIKNEKIALNNTLEQDVSSYGKNTLNNTSEQDVSRLIEGLLADNVKNINEYNFKNGKKVSLSDFEVVNLEAQNSKEPVATGVTFSNPEEDNTTIIELEIKDIVFKNGNEYKLTGYIVYMDNNYQNLESGIYAELLE